MDLEDLGNISNNLTTKDEADKLVLILNELLFSNYINKKQFLDNLNKLSRKYKIIPSLVKVLGMYRTLCSTGKFNYDSKIVEYLRRKNGKSLSGIVSITVFTSPYPETSKGIQNFSCEYDCHYCPKEPNQPRSYLLNEPGVLRANNNKFISTDQFWDRALSLIRMGHPLDKIELIVSGGTFSSYPEEYIINFMRDQFYAANISYDKFNGLELRDKYSLEEEQDFNQNISLIKIIGITIETRPDRIKKQDLIFFRKLGVTRVQLGVQHIDDRILNYINRKCNNNHTIKAIKALKEASFKVDIHIMPDLPHPEYITNEEMIELDRDMFNKFLEDENYQADQWKIYPCETVPWTEIEKWYKEGKYKPYAEDSDKLIELLIEVKSKIKPWIRLNRIIRDIPNSYIIGGNKNTSMRCDLLTIMKERNLKCNCIRCREIKDIEININEYKIVIYEYKASDGIEYFISYENDNYLLGFIRLRINETKNNKYFSELNDCALIRELHVYGQLINHNNINDGIGVQHKGIGKKLINKAKEIAIKNNYYKLSVIAGIGVRNYYIKQGFNIVEGNGNFLILNIDKKNNISCKLCIYIFSSILIAYIGIIYNN